MTTCPKCLFCGAKQTIVINWSSGNPTSDFACGTEQLPGGFIRGTDCYEAQLSQQGQVMKDTLEEIRGWMRRGFNTHDAGVIAQRLREIVEVEL